MHLDLNLLTALDALLEEGGVALAAQRLHLSQPAMSRTLGRIRAATGDPILVRTGRAMTPTPHALAIRAEVHALVQVAHAMLTPERHLDLGKLARTFTLRCHDAVLTALGPGLLATIQAQAPGVTLRLLGEAGADGNDLRHGHVDLEINSTERTGTEICAETIGHDRLVVALRPEHPCTRGKFTLRRYAQARHLIVSRQGRLRDPVDEALESRGLRRHVAAAFPTSTAALHAARQSDCLVAVTGSMCRSTIQSLGLRTLPIPLVLTPVPVILAWPRRYEGDKAHRWLRQQVRQVLQAL